MIATQSYFYDKKEQPDSELLLLAQQVNKRTRAGRITFFGAQFQDGIHWSVIFQDGSKRAAINLSSRPTEEDIDDIIAALEAWAGFHDEGSLYTTDLPRA